MRLWRFPEWFEDWRYLLVSSEDVRSASYLYQLPEIWAKYPCVSRKANTTLQNTLRDSAAWWLRSTASRGGVEVARLHHWRMLGRSCTCYKLRVTVGLRVPVWLIFSHAWLLNVWRLEMRAFLLVDAEALCFPTNTEVRLIIGQTAYACCQPRLMKQWRRQAQGR